MTERKSRTTPKGTKSTQPKDEPFALSVSVDGQNYELEFATIGPAQARVVRQATGSSIRRLFAEVGESDPDIDIIGPLIWLARNQSGDDITLEEVESGLTYKSKINVTRLGELPEA